LLVMSEKLACSIKTNIALGESSAKVDLLAHLVLVLDDYIYGAKKDLPLDGEVKAAMITVIGNYGNPSNVDSKALFKLAAGSEHDSIVFASAHAIMRVADPVAVASLLNFTAKVRHTKLGGLLMMVMKDYPEAVSEYKPVLMRRTNMQKTRLQALVVGRSSLVVSGMRTQVPAVLAPDSNVKLTTSDKRLTPDSRPAIDNPACRSAQSFIDAVIIAADAARHRNEKVIVGLDTSWVTNDPELADSMRALLSRLRHISRKKGLDNIVVSCANDAKTLAELLNGVIKETGTPLKNVIVVGDKNVVGKPAALRNAGKKDYFEAMRTGSSGEIGAFFGEIALVDGKLGPGIKGIDLAKLLSDTLMMAFDPMELSKDKPKRVCEILPAAYAVNVEKLKYFYALQVKFISNAA
ncbi:MAG: hypothetical protein HQL28_06270, partial [Candidatus Omnitrophica bacterium]|nr:hypothetical protein [Candidatus Omnitrophota bacterium]